MCVSNHHYASYLSPKVHRSSDGCDFSDFVARFKPEHLDINCDNIHEVKIGKVLGSGSVREVYEGYWNGSKFALKISYKGKNISKTTQEAAVLYELRREPNIIRLVGWCNETIVLPKLDRKYADFRKDSTERALQISLDIAKGVQQMHAINVTHGDIKWSQFLYDKRGKLLLGDLDLMQFTGFSNKNEKCKFMTRGYGPFDERSDIGRIALLLGDILKGINEKSIEHKAMEDLIEKASSSNMRHPPSATKIVKRIEAILRNYKTSQD